MALKIDTLLDFCNDVCIGGNTQAQDGTCQTLEDSVLAQQVKGKRLSEATFAFRTPCQASSHIRNYYVILMFLVLWSRVLGIATK